ncbi:hypothetical protein CP533_2586 [Ophiocordyceps camponoti-saundersi (nom. inval.)]|nr:hypothetical protein CP533_2586 [Ophiocordyceps camponoti-saundersi (nom. inval.)]
MATTTGSCACDDVRIEFIGQPVMTALCHCADCQKWTGGAFTSNIVVQRNSFQVTKGQVKSWDVTSDNGHANRRFFCANCGSGLYSELDILPDYTCIKAGSLHGRAAGLDGKVDFELYAKQRVDYLRPCSGARQEPFFDLKSPAIAALRLKTKKEEDVATAAQVEDDQKEPDLVSGSEYESVDDESEVDAADDVDTDTEFAYGFTPKKALEMEYFMRDPLDFTASKKEGPLKPKEASETAIPDMVLTETAC